MQGPEIGSAVLAEFGVHDLVDFFAKSYDSVTKQ
jgi:hypothetical protein